MSRTEHETAFQFPALRALGHDMHEQTQVLTAELQVARARTD